MGSPFFHFAVGRSHLPENSILFINRPFSAQFSNCCNSLNFESKIIFSTIIQNDLKWRKTCIRLKYDLEHFYGPQTKFICDSLYKHPVVSETFIVKDISNNWLKSGSAHRLPELSSWWFLYIQRMWWRFYLQRSF